MRFKRERKPASIVFVLALLFSFIFAPLPQVVAADHNESTSVASDPGADLADVFAFLDPADNSKVVLIMTVAGFVTGPQLANLSFFSPDIVYRFEIENTGDPIPDAQLDVTFSPQTSRNLPQTASIQLRSFTKARTGRFKTFKAPTTVQTTESTPRPFVVTTDQDSGVSFYAGSTDDPFYFDAPGFSRFTASVATGIPDLSRLQRSRDSFAGYNIHAIAVELPAAMLRGTGNVIGVNGITLRQRMTYRQDTGQVIPSGDLVQVDRAGVPAINTTMIPFSRKNEYNAATPINDASGLFASEIVGTLTTLGTNATNIGILAVVAVVNGDYLRLDLTIPNNNIGFGQRATTQGYTGFPNGRRTGDDVVDVLMYYISNQTILNGDNVNSNEVPMMNTFPFLAPPHQPFENPQDDRTRN
ncbi:MAG: DUF4331 family protein [Acidobacteriota bacterium]